MVTVHSADRSDARLAPTKGDKVMSKLMGELYSQVLTGDPDNPILVLQTAHTVDKILTAPPEYLPSC